MLGMEYVMKQVSKMKLIKEKEKHNSRPKETRKKDLKDPTDFECFVCGTKFKTNEERKYHLEKGAHGHFYDTISPQEQEEVRSSDDN